MLHVSKGKNMFRLCLLILGLALVGSITAQESLAQSQTDGSIYSRFGLGLRKGFTSSKNQALGGGGLALSSGQYLNTANPASFSDQYLTRFSGGMTYETITASAEGVTSGRLGSGSASGFNFGFPLKSAVTGLGFSFSPYTRVNYRVDVESSVADDPENRSQAPFVTSFKGNGGLQSISAGIGHRVNTNLHVGLTADFIFGIMEDYQQTLFNSPSFTDRSVVSSTRLSGISALAGFRYALPGMPTNQGLVVSGTIHLPTHLSGTRTRSLVDRQDRDTLGTVTDGSVTLPIGIGLGLAYSPAPKWTIVADVELEKWSNFKSDFEFPGLSESGKTVASDRVRASAGAEFWPAARRPFAPWSSRIAYRLGFYTEQSYIAPIDGENIRSIGVTGGLSIPSLIPGTTIDFNLDVGQRGTTSNGLIQDRYVRFGLNLNFGERWFERPPLG